jgi:3'-phosphoadenosine 5'-phosphosulfate sulfotransferase (PAPS reductase)/FAD synthetase
MDEFTKLATQELVEKQSWNLDRKVEYAKEKIREFVERIGGEDKAFVSFSGGKDSTVLLHIARSIYPNIKAVFFDTRLEYPEIVEFVNNTENVDILKPKKTFKEVWENQGIPIASKQISGYVNEVRTTKSKNLEDLRLSYKDSKFAISKKWLFLCDDEFITYNISNKCCTYFKKNLSNDYIKETGRYPIIATMANESNLRKTSWIRYSCNMFDGKKIQSRPMSIWLEDDIWAYIKKYNVKICNLYYRGHARTGCFCCPYGAHLEDKKTGTNRFEIMKEQHPKQYKALEKMGIRQVLLDMGVPIRNDEEYMKELADRQKQIAQWYIKVGNDIAINGENSKYWKYHKYFEEKSDKE